MIKPMLAQDFTKHASKITYPAALQPKLDGIRCIAVLRDGSCNLYTRNGNLIKSCVHIESSLLEVVNGDIILDGELYSHELKHSFDKIVSAVKKQEPTPEAANIQYFIYDIISDGDFSSRLAKVRDITETNYVKILQTTIVNSSEDLSQSCETHVRNGYEGSMVRNLASLYENKRSFNLQKIKEFQDAEFPIVGVVEGIGKLSGLLGAFVCESAGRRFTVKLSGPVLDTKKYLVDDKLWRNKQLTVKFQGYTSTNRVPRFPIGIAVRDYE